MTRNGKIARLPLEVREEVNRRLRDGMAGTKIVEWLNTLPAVKEAITEPNLSRWKQGGYRDWLMEQGAREIASELMAGRQPLEGVEVGEQVEIAETLAIWTAARYALLASRRVGKYRSKKSGTFCARFARTWWRYAGATTGRRG